MMWNALWRRNLALALMIAALTALTGCSSFGGWFEKDNTGKWDAERFLVEARAEMSSGNWAKGREYLQKLEARFPFTRYAQQAQLEIAYSFYREGETAQALAAVDRFLKLNPNSPAADYAYYLKGLTLFSDDLGLFGNFLGQDPTTRDPKGMREAFDAFKELVTRYPDSRYARDGRDRMNWLVNALAQSEVNIAFYYYQRSAYVAAIDRAQAALRSFQGAPASERALAIMMRSYGALGMSELQADVGRVLEKNFPNSPYLVPNARL
ncbi:MAG: outer membrane protein assembly factor BamD [Betaproteobacteria bacterium]